MVYGRIMSCGSDPPLLFFCCLDNVEGKEVSTPVKHLPITHHKAAHTDHMLY